MDSKEDNTWAIKSMAAVGFFVTICFFSLVLCCVKAIAFSYFWNTLLVPLFAIAPIGKMQAYCLLLVTIFLLSKKDTLEEEKAAKEAPITNLLLIACKTLFQSLFFMVMAWALSYFI